MLESESGIADLSNNTYAASMRHLAESLGGWSGIVLPFYYLYQIFVLEDAHFLSWKTLVLIVGGSLLFVLLWKLINMLGALVAALLITPILHSAQLVRAQNIQHTSMAIVGFLVSVASWYFAAYTTRYMFSS